MRRMRRARYYRRSGNTKAIKAIALLIAFFAVIAILITLIGGVVRFLSHNMWIVFTFIALVVLTVSIIAIHKISIKSYEKYVSDHSQAILTLQKLNDTYRFNEISPIELSYEYDNEIFFDSVSPFDYLVYQLIYIQYDVLDGINLTYGNKIEYEKYRSSVDSIDTFGQYTAKRIILFKKLLKATEIKIFNELTKKPITNYTIPVTLYLTTINGQRKSSKEKVFEERQIKDAVQRLENKNGDRYLDEGIWESICRVERAKVSNKMRFSIYKRDGYRCRKCGISTDNLEIDHIFPIAKGGKSTYDNLQTLCHRCNALKSDTVEPGAINPRTKYNQATAVCPICDARLVRKKGKYGDFWGCSNYPACKFTKKV